MLVSKKKNDFLLARYEQAVSGAGLLDICSADNAYGMAHHQSLGETR
ncbi:TPA: hypothetical protein KW991_003810 [Escherichia coli]|nr:hypothetical protein [Escherichia coli]EIC8563153.1 hypothetical protein [Escherichia coli]EMB1663008.1 hypothetical protein [Escherichia coli]HBH7996359.1 hypothetical protein [Escherichia coli]